jgi:hypothetical protein
MHIFEPIFFFFLICCPRPASSIQLQASGHQVTGHHGHQVIMSSGHPRGSKFELAEGMKMKSGR